MDTKGIIDEAMPDIKAAIAQQLTKSIMDSITYQTTEEIKNTVVKELVEELGPQVRAIVEAHRADLIAKICADLDAVAEDAGKLIAVAMRERLTKQFSGTWESERAIKAIFGWG